MAKHFLDAHFAGEDARSRPVGPRAPSRKKLSAAVTRVLAVVALLTHCALTRARADEVLPGEKLLRQLSPNTWVRIHQQTPDSPGRFARQEHGGSCFDAKRGRLVLFGSNTHGRNFDNSPRIFDPALAAWSQPYPDDAFESYAVSAEGVAVAGAGSAHPWAMHTFGAVVYDSSRDEMVVAIFDEHLIPGRFTDKFRDLWPAIRRRPTWTYQFASGRWEPLPGDGANCFPYCATYDSDRRAVVAVRPDGIHELAGEPRV